MNEATRAAGIAIISSAWHPKVTNALVRSAVDVLDAEGYEHDHFRAPSAFDLPLAVGEALRGPWLGAVALGAVIQGHTSRHVLLAQSITQRLGALADLTRKPVGFGVLFVQHEAEALDRAGLPTSRESRGAEAAQSVLRTLRLLEMINLRATGGS